ncbi:MAG: hypothetical protein K2X29_05420 [Candidatus Obscuribacterales bacterium]|nr:hypothetical protein [Candidatus Obscuribacterales bacterium]
MAKKKKRELKKKEERKIAINRESEAKKMSLLILVVAEYEKCLKASNGMMYPIDRQRFAEWYLDSVPALKANKTFHSMSIWKKVRFLSSVAALLAREGLEVLTTDSISAFIDLYNVANTIEICGQKVNENED